MNINSTSPTQTLPTSNLATTSPTFNNLESNKPATTLTENEKISRIFERIFQLTLDPNYSNINTKLVYVGELLNIDNDSNNDTLLMKENLDEVYTIIINLIIYFN